MKSPASLCLTLLLTSGCALAADVPAEPERVGPMGILVFVLVFVALTVAMFAVPFLRRRGKRDRSDKDSGA